MELPDGTIDPKYVTASGHLSDEGWRIGLEWAGIPVVHADDYEVDSRVDALCRDPAATIHRVDEVVAALANPVVGDPVVVDPFHDVDLLGQTIHEDGRFNPARRQS